MTSIEKENLMQEIANNCLSQRGSGKWLYTGFSIVKAMEAELQKIPGVLFKEQEKALRKMASEIDS